MNVLDWWRQLPLEIRETVLRLGLAILALALIWVLRRALAWLVVSPLRRLAARTPARWDDVLLEAIIPPARLLIVAVGLSLGAQILGVGPVTQVFVDHLVRTLVIIAILLAAYRAVDALAPSSVRLFGVTGLTITDKLLPFVRTGIKLILLAIALVIVLQEWGYDVSGVVAGLGLGGLAISLAAKDTVENVFGFATIVGDQPFVVGEFIKTPDIEGTVEHVGVRSTRVRRLDQAYVTVPNSKLASAPILNWSRLSKRWIDMTLRIDYHANRAQIEALLEQIRALLASREQVEPESVLARFINFGPDGLEILVRCYLYLEDWNAFTAEREAINLEIMKIVEDLGLAIALQGRSVYIENALGLYDGRRRERTATQEKKPNE
jgi:MscS family membrane protein